MQEHRVYVEQMQIGTFTEYLNHISHKILKSYINIITN